jgi:predicted Zn-dependent protease
MLRRFWAWLGPARSWTLLGLLAATGLISLVLRAVGAAAAWVIPAQNALILAGLLGSVIVVVGRLDPLARRPLLISVGPALAGLALGVLLPDLLPWFAGAGLGWLFVAQVLLRRNVRREYQLAIRHLRRSEYDQAIAIMDGLISAEPKDTGHYRFRAELYRLQGNPGQAKQNYQHIVDLEPDSGVGYNGLAEVYLQEGDFEQALTYARQAYEREPGYWVMPYNLGLIEDRLGLATETVEHLQVARRAGVGDSRHRLLVHLWLARAYARLGQAQDVDEALAALRRERRGFHEWQPIFKSEQAGTLRRVLAADVELAGRILNGAGGEVLTADLSSVEEKP